jgi:bifunctional DNA-binding transcriptional regulator/antitoxin component of YhaV-PrlF toxin-antitoxin module
MDQREAAELIASNRSVADKIRALDAAGFPRAEIARLLGKRYQHVRNVLEAERQQARAKSGRAAAPRLPPGMGEAGRGLGRVYRLTVESDGRLRLPAEAQAALELKPGGVLVCEIGDGEVTVRGTRAAWARIDRLMAPFRRSEGPPASEEFVAERRAEAAREAAAFERLQAGADRGDDR